MTSEFPRGSDFLPTIAPVIRLVLAVAIAGAGSGAATRLHAQEGGQAGLRRADADREDRFVSASILPSRAVGTTRITMPAEGRFEATNISVRSLIRFAYQVQDFQVVGAPRWVESERFDIGAEQPTSATPQLDGTPRLRAHVRTLLADRFKLRINRETRELPVYELVMARADRAAGPRLRTSSLDCAALARQFRSGLARPDLTRCGIRMSPGTMTAGGVTMGQLARAMSQLTGRWVEDRTGLSGSFDVQLDYLHELARPGETGETASDRALENGPSLFVAVQEQLGLRLDAKRGPVDLLVVAHVERP